MNNQSITLDGSRVVYATEFITVSETGTSSLQQDYATITYVDNEISNINVGSGGGITQAELDTQLAPIIAQNAGQDLVITDINNNLSNNFQTTAQLNVNFYNKTEVDSAIAVVDTKALNNFNGINAINTNLTNNYKNNTQLDDDYYTKTQIDVNNWIDNTALAPYATTATLTTNYQTNSQLATNYYNKGEVDTLVAGAGGGVSNPIELVDANTSIERYTNATKSNVSLDLSINETASAIRLINGTNDDTDTNTYIECNNTTNGTTFFKQVFLNEAVIFNNDTVFLPVSTNGIQLWRISNNTDPTLRIRDGTAQWIYINNNLRCTTANEGDGNIMILNDNSASNNSNRMRLGSLTSAEVGIGKANESGYFLSVGGATKVDSLEVVNNVTMNGDTITSTNGNGIEVFKNTTDASNVLTVKNAQGYIKIHSFNINAYNTSNNSQSLLLLNTATAGGAVYCNNLGIGAIAGGATRLNVAGGGSANFSGDCNFSGSNNTFNNNILVNSRGRIYQQSNANFSLNFISTIEQKFSIQSNRSADPQASDIFINLNDTAGITLNKATTCNETVNVVGKLTAEGEFDVDVNFTGTPEFRVLGNAVNFFERFSITHNTSAGNVEQIYLRNPDTDGETIIEIGTKDVFKVETAKIVVDGDVEYTGSLIPSSDERLKKDIKELDSKKAVDLVKYIVPKTYRFIDDRQQGKSCCGFIANDFMNAKKMPKEWQNIVKEGTDGYLKFDYTMTTPILWSALQHTIKENEEMKDLFKAMKKEMTTLKGEITKLKKKVKNNSDSD